jgi:sulfopyruvate decarboxylase subunit beta
MIIKRIEAIKEIMDMVDNELVISNIGFPSRELYKIKDRPRNFYMMGSMGLASSIGLGIALNTEETVIVIDGDGSVLMNLGSLSTISNYAPKNYFLIILDDSSYGSTGCQPTHTGLKTDLSKLVKGAGIESVHNINATQIKDKLMSLKNLHGPHVVIVQFEPGNSDAPVISLTPIQVKDRFMEAF